MTLDELTNYFAANAPEKVPDWFDIDIGKKPDLPSPKSENLTPELEKQAANWRYGKEYETSTDLEAFIEKYEKAKIARAEWCNKKIEQRYFAWKWYYAEMMAATKNDDIRKSVVVSTHYTNTYGGLSA